MGNNVGSDFILLQKHYLQDTILYVQQSQTLCSYAEDLALHSFDGKFSFYVIYVWFHFDLPTDSTLLALRRL